MQRRVLYLGEIDDSQGATWRRATEVLGGRPGPQQAALAGSQHPTRRYHFQCAKELGQSL
ncbi:MAG: hypothetical protein OXH79_15250 [Boseongicola sp.]|nr:hypothetical protein [Boseongicola sp.]